MTKFLLSVHVLAAILAIGPVAVAASMFPGLLRRLAPGRDDSPVLRTLHRICRVYAGLGLLVPVLGLATASSLGVLTDAWLLVSMLLTAAAGVLLAFGVLPRQAAALDEISASTTAGDAGPGAVGAGPEAGDPGTTAGDAGSGAGAAGRLAMLTGIFNLLWAVVVVLMIVRPGSTTGA